MRAYERFLQYARIDTQSCEGADTTPSTDGQWELARLLEQQMKEMGLSDVYLDGHAYVYGKLPATQGREKEQPVGFIAHLDTTPDFHGRDVKPQVIKDYDGGEILLGSSGRKLEPEKEPRLKELKGLTLITADGMTLLGADDKAGVAEILTMCEELLNEQLPHPTICVCFTPDEEIGHGAKLLDLERFGAGYAYTVDGSSPEIYEYETFNAAKADIFITGYSVHPGDAKDKMIHAATLAMEFHSMLPADEIPEKTEGYEGFYHLTDMEGTPAKAVLHYIIRDHDAGNMARRKQKMEEITAEFNNKYGGHAARLVLEDQYGNMAEEVKAHPYVLSRLQHAMRSCGLEPEARPVRGGTDGAQLSKRGLPCPNIGTGAYNFHGPYEYAVAEHMDLAVAILKKTAVAKN